MPPFGPTSLELGSCKEASAGRDIQSHRAPTRAANAMRLGLRRAPCRAQYARAIHNMPGAAGSLRRRPPKGDLGRGTLKAKRGRPAGPRMKCGWGCAQAYRAQFEPAIHNTREAAGSSDDDRRGRHSKATRGRLPGLRMPCGWGYGPRTSELVAVIPGNPQRELVIFQNPDLGLPSTMSPVCGLANGLPRYPDSSGIADSHGV
jgi:hypothetical protein